MIISKTFVDINKLPDIPDYYSGFQELSNVSWGDIHSYSLMSLKCPEIGFRYILKIGSLLGNFKWSLFIIATIHTLAYINMAKKYSPYIVITLIMFLLDSVQSFFVLRQHLAIAFTIISYPYILSRDFKRFALYMLFAFLCHQTALVFVPVYFVYGIENKKRLVFILLSIAVILYLLILILLNRFAILFVGYESYVDSNESNMTNMLISASYLFTYLLFLKRNVFNSGIQKLVFILLALNFIVLIAGNSFTAINRLMMYYTVGNILAVPITMKYIKVNFIRVFYCISVISLLVYLFSFGSNAEYLNAI